MKHSSRCPRCEGQVFFRIERAELPNYEYANSFVALGITGTYGPTEETGFLGAPVMARTVVELEAWVCRGCAYVELYARDLAVLEEVAREHQGVTVVDRSRGEGPHR